MDLLDLHYLALPNPTVTGRVQLSDYEREQLQTRPEGRRQAGWLAARFLVKEIVLQRLTELGQRSRASEISTLSLDTEGQPMRPRLLLLSQRLPWSVSIAHTQQGVLVAVAKQEGIRVGVDLTVADRRLTAWDHGYTPRERQWLGETADTAEPARLWAIKQAFYKAVDFDRPFRPRCYEVSPTRSGSYQCHTPGRQLRGHLSVAVTPCDRHLAALVVHGDQRWATTLPGDMIPEVELKQLRFESDGQRSLPMDR